MTIIIVGTVLLVWFGTIIWAYALGARNEEREWAAWYLGQLALNPSDEEFDILPTCLECGRREIHQHGCSLAGPHARTTAPPTP